MSTHKAAVGDVYTDAIQVLEAVEKGLAEQPAYARLVIDVLGPDRAFQATLWLLLDCLKVMALQEQLPMDQLAAQMREKLAGPPW